MGRIKAYKWNLQRLHRKTFKATNKEIAKGKQQLQTLLNAPKGQTDWTAVINIKKRINELWRQKEMYWGQRSRLKWIQWGEKNSRFFHATVLQRRERNNLYRLKDENRRQVEGKSEIMDAVTTHFQGIFRIGDIQHLELCLKSVPRKITPKMNMYLLQEVTELEIKNAVENLGSLKAPGPDGLNDLFFKNH